MKYFATYKRYVCVMSLIFRAIFFCPVESISRTKINQVHIGPHNPTTSNN
jgi:hypothetical protein